MLAIFNQHEQPVTVTIQLLKQLEPEKLSELPLPFIAYTKNNGNAFVLITKIDDEKVFYLNELSKLKTKNLSDFFKGFW